MIFDILGSIIFNELILDTEKYKWLKFSWNYWKHTVTRNQSHSQARIQIHSQVLRNATNTKTFMMTSSKLMEIFWRYWPFVRGIHRSPLKSPHKGLWRGALMFSLIWAWMNSWVNNREAGDLRRHRAHYDVTVMSYRHFRQAIAPAVRHPLPGRAKTRSQTHSEAHSQARSTIHRHSIKPRGREMFHSKTY